MAKQNSTTTNNKVKKINKLITLSRDRSISPKDKNLILKKILEGVEELDGELE